MKTSTFLSLLTLAIFFLASCEDTNTTENNPTEKLISIGSESNDGLTVDLFSDDSLIVGLNTLYFQLTDDATGTTITEAHIAQKPRMYMDSIKHSCPYTDPSMIANNDDLFVGEAVFIMASRMMGAWDDTLSVHNEDTNTMHQVVFSGLSVSETNMKKNLVFFDADSNQVIYIVTLNGLSSPEVGSNDFTLTVHKKQSMMSFPEVADLGITITPQMPDMGHGSTGNVDPVYVQNGKYDGTVVFNMTGYWIIDITFSEEGEHLGSVQYDINF
ncbi:MAG: FixH family protein [Candidatus Marinimicrobia bacterium]|nr:FixH family protein [Candidatus Neomarinimicrobiota bacterium]